MGMFSTDLSRISLNIDNGGAAGVLINEMPGAANNPSIFIDDRLSADTVNEWVENYGTDSDVDQFEKQSENTSTLQIPIRVSGFLSQVPLWAYVVAGVVILYLFRK